jgi:hypothetical protein
VSIDVAKEIPFPGRIIAVFTPMSEAVMLTEIYLDKR